MIAAILATALVGTAVSPAPPPADSRYVSMGSSYAAGPGVGTPDPTSGGCARSTSNFARQVAERRHLALVDVACSGATTANILEKGQYGFPAQIAAVTADTALVTILIGGNDVDYVGNLIGLTCRDSGRDRCTVVPDAEVERRFARLPGALRRVVRAVRRRAPRARIILIGYLPAIPASNTALCPAIPLLPADADRMRAVSDRLARTIDDAATRTNIVSIHQAADWARHDACAPQPYVSGDRPARNPAWPTSVAYHPVQAGMDDIAHAIDQALGAPIVAQ